uniref:TOM1-like protein 2-like isoform X2 n=1 Tax=Saccoglossus kowalevskii TaxID=10224 RepID=A0ABM0MP76_SACKO|nr:PREDICTED: TOM1-like protein 2-like isoform X2 [Saccoglossus kowalevskii]
MSFFGTHPFSSQVGQRIERATNETLASEDWALNIEICDIINETEDGPKDAMKAMKKRLIGSKKWKEVMLTLTVMETCVKNCGHRLHLLVCKHDFIKELVKLIQPNNNPPTCVQEKILSLIQSWADAFRSSPDLQGVVQMYNELKQKGIEFPATDLDCMSPIYTPDRTVPEPAVPPPQSRPPTRQPTQQQRPASAASPAQFVQGPVNPTAEQMAKLRSELDVVGGNVRVMSEMLNEMQPNSSDSSDVELLQELNRACRAMQTRVVELIGKVANEEVTGELLHINDDLNNVFVRYDRFERYRTGQSGPQAPATDLPPAYTKAVSPQPQQTPQPQPTESEPAMGQLIDLGFDPPTPQPSAAAAMPVSTQLPGDNTDLTKQLAGMSVTGGSVSSTLGQLNTMPANTQDEFDMFAQARQNTFEDSRKGGSTYSDNTNIDQSGGIAGIVNSKHNNGQPDKKKDDSLTEANTNQEPLTSSEFDRFLAERAAAADALPDINDRSASQPVSANRNRRQIQMEETDNTMFGL